MLICACEPIIVSVFVCIDMHIYNFVPVPGQACLYVFILGRICFCAYYMFCACESVNIGICACECAFKFE